MSSKLLKVRNLTKVFRSGIYIGVSFKAVDDVSFSLDKGRVLIVVGESGCGKSTLAKMILGFLKPTSGEILYKGKNIVKLRGNEEKTFRKEVQPVFQDPFETFNPFHRITYYFLTTCFKFGLSKSKDESKKIIDDVLKKVGMSYDEIDGKYPHEFSGGQLQRLSIARALLATPTLLIADEPVTMVDASARIGILSLFMELNRKYDMSIIYITHDLATGYYLASQVGGDMIVMYRGDVVEMGCAEEVMLNPLHPYTTMLLNSIPEPNPEKRWEGRPEFPSIELKEYRFSGCKFSKRCPHAFSKCYEEKPELFEMMNGRFVRCWWVKSNLKINEEVVSR
ncbi:MAG TPA: ABC transporter ATP-binding protein [Thermotogales bacterium]|nr:ABC transporter ATP-binding protein [Thermotogales bacterium]